PRTRRTRLVHPPCALDVEAVRRPVIERLGADLPPQLMPEIPRDQVRRVHLLVGQLRDASDEVIDITVELAPHLAEAERPMMLDDALVPLFTGRPALHADDPGRRLEGRAEAERD